MLEPRRISSNVVPSVIEDLGNGYWYYNYDIQSEVTITPSQEEDDAFKEETQYNYIQVKVSGKPEYKKCVELIIREFITQTQEFDLINSANKALLADDSSNKDIAKYKEYLAKVEEIKQNIKKDFP